MNDEASTLLRLLHQELRAVGRELAGDVSLRKGKISAFQGAMKVSAAMRYDEGTHPAIAHAHVLTGIGRGPTATLEACIVGIGGDRETALADAARNWLTFAAAPVLSLLHTRPVLGADHFSGTEVWGVPDRHGFVGPVAVRTEGDVDELDAIGTAPFFAGTAELTPPGMLHLAKVTLNAVEGRWVRTLEIDGHAVSHTDNDWPLGLPAPRLALCTRYAVFFRTDEIGTKPEQTAGRGAGAKRWWQFWK